MSYRKMARVSKGAHTRHGGPAVGTLATDARVEASTLEATHLSMTIHGNCSGCGITSEDMERDGWITRDNYVTCLCPSCAVGERCSQCGLTMKVTKTQPGSIHQTRSYFKVGQFVAECTNPDCCNRGYLHGVDTSKVN